MWAGIVLTLLLFVPLKIVRHDILIQYLINVVSLSLTFTCKLFENIEII